MRVTETRHQICSRMDVDSYVKHLRNVKGSMEIAAMTLEGLCNGMEQIEAAGRPGGDIGARIKEAIESAAAKRYEAVHDLLDGIRAHFVPVETADGSRVEYPPMTDGLWRKINTALDAEPSPAEGGCDCQKERAEEKAAKQAPVTASFEVASPGSATAA
jgi:hypothetical protein